MGEYGVVWAVRETERAEREKADGNSAIKRTRAMDNEGAQTD